MNGSHQGVRAFGKVLQDLPSYRTRDKNFVNFTLFSNVWPRKIIFQGKIWAVYPWTYHIAACHSFSLWFWRLLLKAGNCLLSKASKKYMFNNSASSAQVISSYDQKRIPFQPDTLSFWRKRVLGRETERYGVKMFGIFFSKNTFFNNTKILPTDWPTWNSQISKIKDILMPSSVSTDTEHHR